MNPHFAKWDDPETGFNYPGRTRRCTRNGRFLRVPDDNEISITCWCERTIVKVTSRQVLEGVTASCSWPGCRPGCQRKSSDAFSWRPMNEGSYQWLQDAYAAYDAILKEPEPEPEVLPLIRMFPDSFEWTNPWDQAAAQVLLTIPELQFDNVRRVDVFTDHAIVTQWKGDPIRVEGSFVDGLES